MNPLPKRNIPSPDIEDEEEIWKELPPPASLDAEEEWAKADDKQAQSARGTEDRGGEEGKAPMIRMGMREWDYAAMDEDAEEEGPGLPDARLLMDDLRVEGGEEDSLPKGIDNFGSKPASVGWVVYAGLAVIAVLIGTLIYMTVLNERNPHVNPLGIQPLVIEQKEAYPRGELIADLLARKDEARELFGRFVRAKSAEELRALVRNGPGEEMRVDAITGSVNVPQDWKVSEDVRWDVHTDLDPVFGVLSGYFPNTQKFQAFMTLDGGKLRLDWEATVGHGTVPFSKLVEGQGDASKVRVWVEPATFYSAVYPESDYRSFRIHTQLEDPPVWGFARRGTVPEQELSELFHKSMFGGDVTKSAMVLLSLDRGPAGSAANQWLITDVLHKAWVVP